MTDQQIEQEIQAKGLTAPRITPDDVEANIASEWYINAGDGVVPDDFQPPVSANHPLRTLTFCVLVLKNGTKIVGINYGAIDPAQHSAERGREEARKHAIEQIWPLMGYELRSKLAWKDSTLRFCGAFGDGPDAPYPGMIAAFETHYGQSFRDKEWRTEAACWAAAWSKAAARAEASLAEPQPGANSAPIEAIRRILTEVMDEAARNGAGSRSMPDDYVEVAAWLCGVSTKKASQPDADGWMPLPAPPES